MPAFQIVFRTSGQSSVTFNTTSPNPFFLTAKLSQVFFNTTNPFPVFKTGQIFTSFVQTTSNTPIFKSSGTAVVFLSLPPITPKQLVPKIGNIQINGDYTIANVPDATGDYDAADNPGGYNFIPEPYNPYRPYRENVFLWTVYRIWDVYGSATQTPDSQAEENDVPYIYPLIIPTQQVNGDQEIIRGIYEIILIAAPRFNATDQEGTYLDESASAQTGYIISGTDTDFADVLIPGDYLYYLDETNGSLLEIGEVLMDFSNTTLALVAAAVNEPLQGTKLYGSSTQITAVNSQGTVDTFTSAPYTPVIGDTTDFTTNFASGEFLYYVETATGDYKLMGEILKLVNPLTLNLIDVTENVATAGEGLFSSSSALDVINSQGVFDTQAGLTIFGDSTCQFTLFSPGQSLYYQNGTTGLLEIVSNISSIISDNELIIDSIPVNIPTSGERLFASTDNAISLNSSGGTFAFYDSEATYYTLTGVGTSFTSFSPSDYLYIVSDGDYNELGQISFIQDDTSIVFYSPNDIVVTQGDFIVASSAQIVLIDIEGTFEQYDENSYYNVEGSGTTFLANAEPQQYLYYFNTSTGNYEIMGQIYQVFDDTNVWIYNAPTGSVTTAYGLFTSYSLNTLTEEYSQYINVPNLYEIARDSPSWYVTSVGLMIDPDVINCLNQKRYKYLQGVMCGSCNDDYLEFYTKYVGMLAAMEIQDWTNAICLYEKLKQICSETKCDTCQCFSCDC
jgi:hypothetical protein